MEQKVIVRQQMTVKQFKEKMEEIELRDKEEQKKLDEFLASLKKKE